MKQNQIILQLLNAGARIYKPIDGFIFDANYKKHCNSLGLYVTYDKSSHLIFVMDYFKSR